MAGRRSLPHEPPRWVDPAREIWFVTICTLPRGEAQLTRPEISRAVLDAVEFRYRRGQWYPWVFLLMPDHCHALLSFPQTAPGGAAGSVGTRGGSVGTRGAAALPGREGAPRVPTHPPRVPAPGDLPAPSPPTPAAPAAWAKAIRDWKHWLAAKAGVRWQTDFFDHRLRHDESFAEKAAYILANPVRAGLVTRWEDWPHRWQPPDATPFTTIPR